MTFPLSEDDTIRPSTSQSVVYSEGLASGYRNLSATPAYPFGASPPTTPQSFALLDRINPLHLAACSVIIPSAARGRYGFGSIFIPSTKTSEAVHSMLCYTVLTGHGLSYTTFDFSKATSRECIGFLKCVDLTISNTGGVAGATVAQATSLFVAPLTIPSSTSLLPTFLCWLQDTPVPQSGLGRGRGAGKQE